MTKHGYITNDPRVDVDNEESGESSGIMFVFIVFPQLSHYSNQIQFCLHPNPSYTPQKYVHGNQV